MNDILLFQKGSEENHFKMQDELYGVLSLSKRWDSILMWSHYSNNHKGFCVGINGPSLTHIVAKGGPVTYEINYPDFQLKTMSEMSELDMMERMFIETHTKANEWSYEEEYRLSKNFFGQQVERLDCLPANSIVEIILGIAIDEIDKQQILKIAKQKQIKIYQAQKIPFKFEIKREQIF